MAPQKTSNSHSFGEIIESSLHTFKGQSWQWDCFPSFGSLLAVETAQRTVFGIVYAVQTGSIDPGRYPFTYQKTEEELRSEQPQIFEFLQTTFLCLTVGFMENKKIVYQIAPEPPKMHAFINTTTTDTIAQFFSSCTYLHLIFNAPQIVATDELLLALLRVQAERGLLTQELFLEFMETVCLITGDDYRRLKIFMNRAQSLTSTFQAF